MSQPSKSESDLACEVSELARLLDRYGPAIERLAEWIDARSAEHEIAEKVVERLLRIACDSLEDFEFQAHEVTQMADEDFELAQALGRRREPRKVGALLKPFIGRELCGRKVHYDKKTRFWRLSVIQDD